MNAGPKINELLSKPAVRYTLGLAIGIFFVSWMVRTGTMERLDRLSQKQQTLATEGITTEAVAYLYPWRSAPEDEAPLFDYIVIAISTAQGEPLFSTPDVELTDAKALAEAIERDGERVEVVRLREGFRAAGKKMPLPVRYAEYLGGYLLEVPAFPNPEASLSREKSPPLDIFTVGLLGLLFAGMIAIVFTLLFGIYLGYRLPVGHSLLDEL